MLLERYGIHIEDISSERTFLINGSETKATQIMGTQIMGAIKKAREHFDDGDFYEAASEMYLADELLALLNPPSENQQAKKVWNLCIVDAAKVLAIEKGDTKWPMLFVQGDSKWPSPKELFDYLVRCGEASREKTKAKVTLFLWGEEVELKQIRIALKDEKRRKK